MGRWSSPDDFSYYDDLEYRRHDGLERTCHECGEPVCVTREESQQVHVFHAHCLSKIAERLKRRTLKADGVVQLDLFPEIPQPSGLTCSFGTEWLDHFDPPIGTGKGCIHCETPGAATR